MSFSKVLPTPNAAALAAILGLCAVSCSDMEPTDPAVYIPGPQEYYNEALQFSLRYPKPLDLKVEDRSVADEPAIFLELLYPGNEYPLLKLSTYDTGMRGHIRQYMVAGSEKVDRVGGETGSRFEVQDQSDRGETLQHVVVEQYGRLYVFTGRGETFDEVVESFQFVEFPPPPPEE